MSLSDSFYRTIGRFYKYDAVRDVKDALLPLRHAVFGKKGFYKALDVARGYHAGKYETVFDIGASLGDKTRVLARAFPQAKLHAFEPIPEVFERLRQRTSAFGGRVVCHNVGLSNVSGSVDMYASDDASLKTGGGGASSLVPWEKQWGMEKPSEGAVRTVAVRRLDDAWKEMGSPHIDFIKIDVESSERELIEGGREALAETDAVFIEIMPLRRGPRSHYYLDVLEALHGLGFSLVGVHEDFLFVRIREAGSK